MSRVLRLPQLGLFLRLSLLASTVLAVPRNWTIDDTNHLVSYRGNWEPTTQAVLYFNSSKHEVGDAGASAVLKFNGSAIYFIGERRASDGRLTCTLDDETPVNVNAADELWQTNFVMCSFEALDEGKEHTLTVTNDGGGDMTVDAFLVTYDDMSDSTQETSVDASQLQRRNVSIDDSDPAIAYSGSWTLGDGRNAKFFGQTLHATNHAGATAQLTFAHSSAIYFIGSTAANHSTGRCTVEDQVVDFNSSSADFVLPVYLCSFENLDSSKEHTITVENLQDGLTNFIDYFLLTMDYYPPPSHSSKSSVNVGAIAGGVVGGIAAFALVILGFFFYRRRKSRRQPTREPIFSPPMPVPLSPPVDNRCTPGHTSEGSEFSEKGDQAFRAFNVGLVSDFRNRHQLSASPPSTQYQQSYQEGYGGSPYPSRYPEIHEATTQSGH
ncbi:hypothetical protein BT69DRAFT_1318649 [Atractiella rhizophila]|nr:hypothetical protein BT69DRAFT_1318649 [Atractiella rhizophila]